MKKIALAEIIKKTSNILYWLVFVVVLFVAAAMATSALNVPGGFRFYTVQSGSMEPKIHTGSVVIDEPKSEYQKGDVITFKVPNSKSTVSHRIVEIKEDKNKATFYQVKGDANNSPDTDLVAKDNVVGKVVYSIPYLGYPIAFARTQTGFIFLIVIPATLIVYSELMTIKNEAFRLLRESRSRKLTTTEKVEEAVGLEVAKIEEEVKKDLKMKKRKKP